MRINNNIMAFNAQRNLSASSNAIGKSLEKLSSGFRINRAADDAAGLVISQGLRAQVSGLKQATRNAQDGISVVQTAEGALTEVHNMLNRMRDLAVQSANSGAMDDAAKDAANAEFGELQAEIDRIATATKFGSKSLLSGGAETDGAREALTFDFQVGANSTDAKITVEIGAMDAASLGVGAETLSIGRADGGTTPPEGFVAGDPEAALTAIDAAIAKVSETRGDLGAKQNRFESTIANLQVTTENLSASESRIRDTDMAAEMVSFTKNQILQQAGTAMLGQANQLPQGVLRLLG